MVAICPNNNEIHIYGEVDKPAGQWKRLHVLGEVCNEVAIHLYIVSKLTNSLTRYLNIHNIYIYIA